MTDTALDLQLKLAGWEDEIATRPDPPAWRAWDARELAALREHGPAHSPSGWFAGHGPMPERVCQRVLRTLHRLAADGLLKLATSEGGRLKHVRLLPAGRDASRRCTPAPIQPGIVAHGVAQTITRPSRLHSHFWK